MSDAASGQPVPASRRFNPDGSARHFPGNAVMCRIGSGNPGFGTIASIQSALRHESFAGKFAFVPPSSFHMTVFDGAKTELRDAGAWPPGLSGRPLAEVTAHFAEKLARIDAPSGFRMRPTGVVLDPERGSIIQLAPGDPADARRLKLFRERLADLLGMPIAPQPYAPHITLSHLAADLDAAEHRAVGKTHAALTVHLSRALSMLELNGLEFCTHENVLYFERRFYLDGGAR